MSPESHDDPGISSVQSTALDRGSSVVPANRQPGHSSEQNRLNGGPASDNVDFITAPSAVTPVQADRVANKDKWKHHRVDSGKEFLAPPPAGGHHRPIQDRTVSASPTLGSGSTVDTYTSSAPPEPQMSHETPNNTQSTRVAIQRQLRFMFIYPIVYLCLWTPAFAFHCTQYNDYLAFHPPYWLQVLTLVTINIQAAADSLIFLWRERPWRRVENQRPGPASRLRRLISRKSGKTPHEKPREAATEQLDWSMASNPVHWWEREDDADEADASGENGSDSMDSAKISVV